MSDMPPSNEPILNADEKSANVMAYTLSGVYWGKVVIKAAIRPSTWLRTNVAPDYIRMYSARAVITAASQNAPRPLFFSELNLPTCEVRAFHLIPPAQDPPDYDPTEPNRRLESITALIGAFRFDGGLRIAASSSLSKYLDVIRESFTGLYEVDISNLAIPAMGVMHVPFVIVRQANTVFARRSE